VKKNQRKNLQGMIVAVSLPSALKKRDSSSTIDLANEEKTSKKLQKNFGE
jgi:hypothetical protein